MVVLLACASLYAAAVHWLRHKDPDHGLTPFLVVIGNSMIIAAVYVTRGIEIAGWLLVLNAIAGAPMVISYYLWRINGKSKSNRRHREF
jgi:hypothetical protein